MRGVELAAAFWHCRPDHVVLGRRRSAAMRFLIAAGVDQICIEHVVVVLDELVTNALQHARTAAVLALGVGPTRIRVAVTDLAPADPAACWARPDPDAGLNRVHALSAWLYLEPAPPGKTVIAEVPRR